MKNYKDSDYALNKYADGIVYRFADGITEVTLAAYLAENPDKTKTDFATLKALSDAIYYDQVTNENAQTKKDVSVSDVDAMPISAVPSAEEILLKKLDDKEHRSYTSRIITGALSRLTPTQKRRYLLYALGGLTTRQIAKKEGASQSSVMNSIAAAEKKIKIFLE